MKRTRMLKIKAVLLVASILTLAGCGKTEKKSSSAEISEVQCDMTQAQVVTDDEQEQDGKQEDAASDHKTQEEWDEISLKERAELEMKVKAAGGITEDEAIEIAERAMEHDLGEKAKELKIHEVGDYGWKAYLWDITDWDEYKDKGEIGWFVGFDNLEDFEGNPDDSEEIENFMFSYNCTVNAMDGSICGAYSRKGFISGEDTWYEH